MSNLNDFTNLTGSFKALIRNPELNYQILDFLPIPLEIFTPDGVCIFANRLWLEINNITDLSLVAGKYNAYTDPLMIEILGQENLDKIFRGETWSFSNFPVPIQDLLDRNIVSEKPFEAAKMDIFCIPVWEGDKFVYTIAFFTVKNIYIGRTEIAKAKEYMNDNWFDEFNASAIAKAANISRSHLHVLFRDNVGMTMNDYYKRIKVNHIKEKLADKNLSIAQAFSLCGEDSRGTYARVFKELTSMTPTEYRNSLQ